MSAGAWFWFWAIAIAVAWWRIDLYFHPYAKCRKCKGSGQNAGSRVAAWGLCKHGPRRLRFMGRHLGSKKQLRRGKHV